jgi:hypothetical protein
MADNTAALISASNWMMRAWEMGNEAEYRGLTTPEFRMVIYLATGLACSRVPWNFFVLLAPDGDAAAQPLSPNW